MDIKVGNFSGDVDACFALGKEAFLSAHSHLDNAESIWKEIEKAGKKAKKNDTEGETN